jgi:hypothetical protein
MQFASAKNFTANHVTLIGLRPTGWMCYFQVRVIIASGNWFKRQFVSLSADVLVANKATPSDY